ncbi:MAG: hypothetical protein KW793_03525 [Candidatus Doudnabacteria bacterium]|nr:hypothetical protein [Candidatus Doudnabacteria bacterium]
MNMEFGPSPEMEEEEIGLDNGPEKKKDAGITEQIEKIRNECSHVYAEPENGNKLDQLIKTVNESYEVDPKGFLELLKSTKQELVNAEDDTQAIEDILRESSNKAAELM